MTDNDRSTLRSVAWSEICPWLAIFRTFRLAISFRVLFLGAVAILLTVSVWGLIGWMFSESASKSEATHWTQQYTKCCWEQVTDGMVPDHPESPLAHDSLHGPADLRRAGGGQPSDPFFGPWAQLTRPLWAVFSRDATYVDLACLLLCGLSSLAIWAFFGGAITRIVAVQLAVDERISWGAAFRHACKKWPAYFAAPLFPLIGVALAAIPVWLIAWLLRADLGIFVAAFLWPLLLGMGLIMTLLLLGLIFGWPLMWSTISTEGTDSFDALSRSYAYVFQRPVHYLFFAVVASVFGWLGWLLVKNFAAGVVWLTYWAAGWSGTTEQIDAIMSTPPKLDGIGYAGALIIRFWAGCVKLLAVGFVYGYFWTAISAIYYLLRRSVDATEMDEVFLDADQSEQTYGLPQLKTDGAGAPVVAEEAGKEEGK
jgi:hypothetical protein